MVWLVIGHCINQRELKNTTFGVVPYPQGSKIQFCSPSAKAAPLTAPGASSSSELSVRIFTVLKKSARAAKPRIGMKPCRDETKGQEKGREQDIYIIRTYEA